MDSLLRQFELLSLPSRVNWNEVSENSLDRTFDFHELQQLFEALVAKKDATSFQWRKLREASLISLKTQIKEPRIIEFMINVYEKSSLFSLQSNDFAECHIAMTKLLEFYRVRGEYNESMLQAILLFRFYNGTDPSDSIRSVIESVQFSFPSEIFLNPSITEAFEIIRLCSNLNIFSLRRVLEAKRDKCKITLILLELIEKRIRKQIAQQLSKAYSLTSEGWICKLLDLENFAKIFELGVPPERVNINEGKVKFLKNIAQ